jgi:hypothetical protein
MPLDHPLVPLLQMPNRKVKLHVILSTPEYQDIISWLPHGRSWRVLRQQQLEETVLPIFFRHG